MWQTIRVQDGYVDYPTTTTEVRQELVSAGYPTQEVTIERTVIESGNSGIYKSIVTNQYVTMDGTNTRHPCCPIVTTDASGALPDIQPQNSKTQTDVATIGGTAGAGNYVVKAGLSYQDYLKAIDILAKIAAGGTDIMHQDFSNLITTANAVNQTNVITTTDVKVDGVKNAVIPIADIEKSLRPPGASTTTPEGLVAVGGSTGAGTTSFLPKADTTHLQNGVDVLAPLGGNSVQIGPATYVEKIGTKGNDMLNKFSVPSEGKMDVTAVSNDTVLFIDANGSTVDGTTGSRVLGAPIK